MSRVKETLAGAVNLQRQEDTEQKGMWWRQSEKTRQNFSLLAPRSALSRGGWTFDMSIWWKWLFTLNHIFFYLKMRLFWFMKVMENPQIWSRCQSEAGRRNWTEHVGQRLRWEKKEKLFLIVLYQIQPIPYFSTWHSTTVALATLDRHHATLCILISLSWSPIPVAHAQHPPLVFQKQCPDK